MQKLLTPKFGSLQSPGGRKGSAGDAKRPSATKGKAHHARRASKVHRRMSRVIPLSLSPGEGKHQEFLFDDELSDFCVSDMI